MNIKKAVFALSLDAIFFTAIYQYMTNGDYAGYAENYLAFCAWAITVLAVVILLGLSMTDEDGKKLAPEKQLGDLSKAYFLIQSAVVIVLSSAAGLFHLAAAKLTVTMLTWAYHSRSRDD